MLLAASVTSCKHEGPSIAQSLNSPNGGTKPAFDTSASLKEVAVSDKNHRIYFRPHANTTQRYHIVDKISHSQDVVDQLFNSPGGKQSAVNSTEYYLRQTIREVKKDSSLDIKYRIDSIQVTMQQDTMKMSYSSNRPGDRKDSKFNEYNVIAGQEFGVIVSRFGEILEMYDLQPMVSAVMKDLPDSMKTDRYKELANRNLQSLLHQYINFALTRFPDKPLAKDSSWGIQTQSNFPVSPAVQFPVSVDSKEQITSFEERGGEVLAVLYATSHEAPTQSVFTQGGVKASLNDFHSDVTTTTHVDDATGVVVRRELHSKQSFVFMLQSEQQAGKVARSSQSATEDAVVDLLN